MRWAPLSIVRRGQLATLLPAAIARENRQLKKVALANAMPARQAVLLQRKDAYRSAAAQAFIAVLQQQGVTPTHSSAASSPADAPVRSRGKSAS